MDNHTLLHHLTQFLVENEDIFYGEVTLGEALNEAKSYAATIEAKSWTESFTADTAAPPRSSQ